MHASTDDRRALGRRGEDLALAHLCALGCEVVDRNHRTRYGEIDLIVRDGDTLVFVEVKTRRTTGGASPSAPLDGLRARQRRRLRRLAAAWLADTSSRPRTAALRFDAIGVLFDAAGALVRLDHVTGAL